MRELSGHLERQAGLQPHSWLQGEFGGAYEEKSA